MSQQPVFGRLVGARSLRHLTWHRIESANMSREKTQYEKEHAECVKALTNVLNLLAGSGVEGIVVLGAVGSVYGMMLGSLAKYDQENGGVLGVSVEAGFALVQAEINAVLGR